jgi:hypothetical protein
LGFGAKAGLTSVLPWAKNISVAGVDFCIFFSKKTMLAYGGWCKHILSNKRNIIPLRNGNFLNRIFVVYHRLQRDVKTFFIA